jgi:hypothetical protein
MTKVFEKGDEDRRLSARKAARMYSIAALLPPGEDGSQRRMKVRRSRGGLRAKTKQVGCLFWKEHA